MKGLEDDLGQYKAGQAVSHQEIEGQAKELAGITAIQRSTQGQLLKSKKAVEATLRAKEIMDQQWQSMIELRPSPRQ